MDSSAQRVPGGVGFLQSKFCIGHRTCRRAATWPVVDQAKFPCEVSAYPLCFGLGNLQNSAMYLDDLFGSCSMTSHVLSRCYMTCIFWLT